MVLMAGGKIGEIGSGKGGRSGGELVEGGSEMRTLT